jgi:hypothetical protein
MKITPCGSKTSGVRLEAGMIDVYGFGPIRPERNAMATAPPAPVPTISPAEIQILISRAGLVLNPGQVADLVLAWRQVAGLVAALPRDRPLADDMALAFRLPLPADGASLPTARGGRAPRLAPAKAAARARTAATDKAKTPRAPGKAGK